VEALSVLGRALTELDDIDGGLDAYRKAVLLSPYDPLSYRRLGYGLFAAGRMDEALDVYQKWLERMPDSAEARHYIAAWTGEGVPKRASDEFVRQVFDRFADSFDDVLRGNLGYRAPELLADAIGDVCGPPAGSLDVLDAGCGTGLCAPTLRPYARRLVGVDLSAQMLTRADGRGGYDELVCADLVRHLAEHDATYDLIVSADTLVYFGELAEALGAAATSLRPGGMIAFTLERAEQAEAPDGFRLNAHGRYSQTEPYVRAALAEAGLETIRLHRAHLRTERGKPVEGLVVVAARRRTSARQ
jgi:predicted TPR repeat methyltransferase